MREHKTCGKEGNGMPVYDDAGINTNHWACGCGMVITDNSPYWANCPNKWFNDLADAEHYRNFGEFKK